MASAHSTQPSGRAAVPAARRPACRAGTRATTGEVLALLQPGSFVKLRNHPDDLPPFELIGCRGGRCWVRQQAWGTVVQWEVEHRTLTPVHQQAA